MQLQVDIEFDQLVKIVKTLPAGKLRQLKAAIENESKRGEAEIDLRALLLNGPVATKKQAEVIEDNRKAVNQWRKK